MSVNVSVFYLSFISFDSQPLFFYTLFFFFFIVFLSFYTQLLFLDVISLSLPLQRNPIDSVTFGFLFYFTLRYPFLSPSVHLLSMPSSHRCVIGGTKNLGQWTKSMSVECEQDEFCQAQKIMVCDWLNIAFQPVEKIAYTHTHTCTHVTKQWLAV